MRHHFQGWKTKGCVPVSLFKKMLARVGIGSVKVDFRLPSHQLTAGEEITGTVRIQGGKTEQELQSCEIALFTEYTTYYTDSEGEHRTSTAKVLLNAYTLPCDFHIQSFEVKQYPLSIAIPLHTPITLSREKKYGLKPGSIWRKRSILWIKTGSLCFPIH